MKGNMLGCNPLFNHARDRFLGRGGQASVHLAVNLKGEETVASYRAKGEEFAVVDDHGLVRILSPREIALSKIFNPQVLQQRAFGLKYRELAPEINPLKRRAIFGPGR
jgi:hypothetical protein